MKKHKITQIEPGSIAEELELSVGDYLLTINGKEIVDIFDYQFLVEDEELEILIERADGEEWLLEVEKDYDEDLGLCFAESLMDNYRRCSNNCVFCFIDQNPPGMRETIYFKDDDTRLSFLQGNYVTLTNLQEKDIQRIIDYKLAPINISVHTTNEKLRCEMLHNRFAGRLKQYMDMLYKAEIPMNAQVVLCKGLNDGVELDKTISDLMEYAPYLESMSVVPVGLSKYREGLYPLEAFDKEDAKRLVGQIEKYQAIAMERFGYHFVHASDEWYINAGVEVPTAETYDGYVQLENGVGMTRLLYEELDAAIADYRDLPAKKMAKKEIRVSTISGMLIHEIMRDCAGRIHSAEPKFTMDVHAIKNEFFGERITVTGLLTGGDIARQLSGTDLGEALLLPQNCLKADEDIFLDDMTVEQLQKALQVPIVIVKCSGLDLFDTILALSKRRLPVDFCGRLEE